MSLNDHSHSVIEIMEFSDLNKCSNIINLIQVSDDIALITVFRDKESKVLCSVTHWFVEQTLHLS